MLNLCAHVGCCRQLGRLLRQFVIACCAALLVARPPASFAQEMMVLDLRGPGTSIVTFDKSTKTAYIGDGGNAGVNGVKGALIDGRNLMDAILERGTKTLIIICSHPHSDHLGGLLDLIKDLTKDNGQISALRFVDSEYPERSRLVEEYRKTADRSRDVQYKTACANDALGQLNRPGGSVRASNFVYEPIGTAPHGRSIIMSYELERNGSTTRVVDFDDASNALVRQFAEFAREDPTVRRPDCIIIPHHGSDLTDISPLLRDEILPTWAIITVNPDNRHGHPGPDNVIQLMRKLGPENVQFTGGSANINITEQGVLRKKGLDQLRLEYELFFKKSELENEREIFSLAKRENLNESEKVKLKELRKEKDSYRTLDELMTKHASLDPGPLSENLVTKGADDLVFPWLKKVEDEARALSELEAKSRDLIQRVRNEFALGQIHEAARHARDGLEAQLWLSARERNMLKKIDALSRLSSGSDALLDPCMLHWPEIGGETAAKALFGSALRDARKIIIAPENVSSKRVRMVVDALVGSGCDGDAACIPILAELRYRLLVDDSVDEVDIRAVNQLSPAEAGAQLRKYKLAIADTTVSSGPSTDVTTDLIDAIDSLLRKYTVVLDEKVTRRAANVVSKEIKSVWNLRETEKNLFDDLAKQANRQLSEPMLDFESRFLRCRFRIPVHPDEVITDIIPDIRARRKYLQDIVQELKSAELPSIPFSRLLQLTSREISVPPARVVEIEAKLVDDLKKLKSIIRWLRR